MTDAGTETPPISTRIDACRSCGSPDLVPFLDLGPTPLVNRLLRAEQLDDDEVKGPLETAWCEACSLVQITETVSPEVLFCQDYPYFSSVSKALLDHFAASARHLIEARSLGEGSLVMEAASNDGYMLENFARRGIPVLGIDPADGPVAAAREKGIETLEAFFSADLARRLADEGRRADVFLANNVLAHVPDINGFVEGIATVLNDGGVAVIEAPYLGDLVEHTEFDTIYHEHVFYYSATALVPLFRRHGLSLNDVKHVPIHGGTLRLFVEKEERPSEGLTGLLEAEKIRGLDTIEPYRKLATKVEALRDSLVSLLEKRRADGDRIAGYAAAAKGCVLMSYCGIGPEHLEYVVDRAPAKQGMHMPGNHLAIHPVEKLAEDRPDALLILAWNFADEIMKQQDAYRRAGGQFIIPVPEVRVVL